MDVDPIAVIGLVSAILIPVLQYVFYYGKHEARTDTRLANIEGRMDVFEQACRDVTELKVKIEPFWKIIDQALPDMLKGKQGCIDQLLLKFQAGQIDENERWELIDALTDKYRDTVDIGTKMAYIMLIARLKSMPPKGDKKCL